ncbi:MAG TPA: hypothetical protein VN768_06705 [Acidimicrobiales bacterium]|nr:hypothetical protein [Acidimicrobiales bacterium]
MARTSSIVRRLTLVGVAALVVGGALVVTSVAATAATPKLTLTWTGYPAPLTKGEAITATGTGFADTATGTLVECNMVSGEPTITVTGFTNPVPVGCSKAVPSGGTTNKGVLYPTAFNALTGVIGPPAQGTDSAGKSAATDAANYPCPPYQGQTGATCEIGWIDNKGDAVFDTVTFNPSTTPTTTPTTTAPCNPQPATASNVNAMTGTTATVTVTPATCLTQGTSVIVTGTGLVPNSLGSILECNTDGSQGTYAGTANATLSTIVTGSLAISHLLGKPDSSGSLTLVASGGTGTLSYSAVTVSGSDATFTGLALTTGTGTWTVATGAFMNEGQPYVTFLGTPIPVSCTAVVTFSTTATGGIAANNQQFTVEEGVTGPPAPGTDSNGVDGATDAKNYPCPPTTAQVAKGDGCVIAVGDVAGDKVPVPIQFNLNAPPVTTTTAAPTTTAANLGNTVTTAAASTSPGGGTLAFTGTGPRLWWVALVGVALMILGLLALVVVDQPRRLLRLALARVRSRGRT